MDNNNCSSTITSENYANFILERSSITSDYLNAFSDSCIQNIGNFAILYQPLDSISSIELSEIPYSTIPKLFGLMDTSAVDAVNATRLQNLPSLSLRGQGTLIGMIDTGIDYLHPAFIDSSGSTRIRAIWNQTIEAPPDKTEFIDVPFGTTYDYTAINRAINASTPLNVVPSTDTNGHGTFLAGVCAGSVIEESDFTGVAPDSELLIVKLKQAKSYLRRYFLILDDVECFQEDDIMSAVYFLLRCATIIKRPIVICIGLGSSQGAHTGASPLSQMLNQNSQKSGCAICLPIGNEGDSRKHFSGIVLADEDYTEVELRIAAGESSFTLELWGQPPEIFSIALISPSGESVPRIPARLGQSDSYSFLFDNTVLVVEYALVENLSGSELILIRFITPAEGIWKIRVYSKNNISGRFNMWLPISQFVNEGTYFLESTPDVTLTSPSSTLYPMSVGAYNHFNNSLYLSSGRGYSINGAVKPDFVAPGVNVYGPIPGGGYTTRSGTSIAAAITAGVASQFMTWAIELDRANNLNGLSLKNYLIRGATRVPNETYPNNRLGYGLLNALIHLI